MRLVLSASLVLLLAACQMESRDTGEPAPTSETASDAAVSTTGDFGLPTDEEVEAARYAGRGLQSAEIDTTGRADAARSNPETLATIDSTRDWSSRMQLPLGGDVAGPSVAKLQVLLSRAGFSPGQIDGRWGDNTEMALTWFQKDAGLKATGIADNATVRALSSRGGAVDSLVTTYTLTADDVAGPFEPIPSDVYEKAEMDRLGFESLSEKLGERFHAAPALLSRLNDGATLDSLAAGDRVRVPNVRGARRPGGQVSRVVISGRDGWLHALAANGDVLFHAPVTVGGSYDPSPEGEFSITSVTRDPSWHYQPKILASVPDDQPDATLPPGPNNAVGSVWMALSKEHYGIHGTSAPGTIGVASSAGCVRLTNWDALRLADMVRGGTPVRFRDSAGGPAAPETERASRDRQSA